MAISDRSSRPPDRSSRPADNAPDPSLNGVASRQHQGLHRPNDDRRVQQALDNVGLEDRGEVLEDQLRDRRSRGAPPAGINDEMVDESPPTMP